LINLEQFLVDHKTTKTVVVDIFRKLKQNRTKVDFLL